MSRKNTAAQPKSFFRELVEALLVALILAFAIRTFVIQPFTIPSGSMEKTLLIGDYLLVNKFLYGLKNPFTGNYLIKGRDPQIGDIIVFQYPVDPSVDFIKRIVGLPGDVIEVRNKQLYRNAEPVREGYIRHSRPNLIGPLDNVGPVTVPEGKYFVMGDNRDNSADSREWGTVSRSAIHGKAWRIHWSWDSANTRVRLERLGNKLE
jgi:signal peptidase I